MPIIPVSSNLPQCPLTLCSAIVEPDPVPVEDVIEDAVAEDLSAPLSAGMLVCV